MKVKYCLAAVLMAVVSGVTVSCSDNEAPEEGIPGPGTEGGTTPEEVTMTVSGDVSGVWEKNSVVRVAGDIRVPQGSALTIEEGVKVLVRCRRGAERRPPVMSLSLPATFIAKERKRHRC